MKDEGTGGDKITVGEIVNAQGVAIGREASAKVVSKNTQSHAKIDLQALRNSLESLYDSLEQGGLPRDKARSAQTWTGNALSAAKEEEVSSEVVVENVKKVGEAIKAANMTVQEGTSLWTSVQELAPLLGPLVGGARVVAGWFGVPI